MDDMHAADLVPDQDEMARGMTSEAALTLLLRSCVAEIDQSLAVFMDLDDDAGPHKSRVALRRLTTVFDAFQPLFRKSVWRPLRSEAKAIFRQLGKVRDAQVFLAGLDDQDRNEKLLKSTARLRDKVRSDLRKRRAVVYGPSVLRRLSEGKLLKYKASGLVLRGMAVDQLASQAMDDIHAACRVMGRDLAALRVEELHEFRKRMKSFRYLAEFFAPLWQHADWPALRRDLKDIQDALGDLNDQANARRRGAEVEPAKAEKSMKAAQKYWERLIDAPAWWYDRPIS